MRELIMAVIGLVLQAAAFYAVGSLVMHFLKMRQEVSLAFVVGFAAYFAMFELLAVPMTLLKVPLHVLSAVWMGILLPAVFLVLILRRKEWGIQIMEAGRVWERHSFWLAAAAAVVLLQCVLVVLYQDSTVDAAYYVGTVSTSVYTDTLGCYDPYTGNLLKYFNARYVFSAFPMNNAVWSQILGLPALIQSKVVMSLLHVLAANLLIYQMGKRLFHGGRKQADLMICFVCLLQLFSYTIYTTGTFFFTRTYEGKAILGNFSIPLVLYCAIWLWQETESRQVWVVLFMTVLSALTFSGSSIIFPAVVSAGILPVILVKRIYRKLVPYFITLLPVILYAAVYFGAKAGWITLAAS